MCGFGASSARWAGGFKMQALLSFFEWGGLLNLLAELYAVGCFFLFFACLGCMFRGGFQDT